MSVGELSTAPEARQAYPECSFGTAERELPPAVPG